MSEQHDSDREMIAKTRNTARFFTEHRQISWVVLVAVLLWGAVAYVSMPKRKDPELPVRFAAAAISWPGAKAEKMEELVTRKVEEKISQNPNIEKVESTTRNGFAFITFTLEDRVKDRGREFDDIALRLATIRDLPQGAGRGRAPSSS